MFVIYHPRAYVRKIPRALGVTALYPEHVRRNKARIKEMTVLVNWGCGRILPIFDQYTARGIFVLNKDISGSVRKLRTFELLDTVGIAHPRITIDPRTIVNDTAFYLRGKYLGRKDGLSGGRGITVYDAGALPEKQHEFYSQIVTKEYEVRIHVAGGNIICEQFKYVPAGSGMLIRNYVNGARFSNVVLSGRIGEEQANCAYDIAIRAVAVCGLQFGAVDMALTKNGKWIVFEINSAPRLSEREDNDAHDVPSTYEAYLDYFKGFCI